MTDQTRLMLRNWRYALTLRVIGEIEVNDHLIYTDYHASVRESIGMLIERRVWPFYEARMEIVRQEIK